MSLLHLRLRFLSAVVGYSVLLGFHFRDRQHEEPGGAGGRLQTVTETPRQQHVATARANIEDLPPPPHSAASGAARGGAMMGVGGGSSGAGRPLASADPNQVYSVGIVDFLTPAHAQRKELGPPGRAAQLPAQPALVDQKQYAARLYQFVAEKTPASGVY